MPIEIQFLSLMPHRVKVEPLDSRSDGWGNKNYARGWVLRGRVVQKTTRIVNAAGQDVVSKTTVYLATASGIRPDDRITLPSGYVPQQPPILSVLREADEDGFHHVVVFC